ncbi:MAG: hypothetical protein ABSH21_04285 [Verrucomicrobiia bacterium]|jgi:hypothetical protein
MKTPREILLKRHQSVEPKLDRMWAETLAPAVAAVCNRRESGVKRGVGAHRAPLQGLLFTVGWKLWRELIWPSRRIWAGLAVAWLLIIGLNMASSEPALQAASKTGPRSGEELRAFIEQRRLLAQLTDALPEPANTRKPNLPGPRSDRGTRISAA